MRFRYRRLLLAIPAAVAIALPSGALLPVNAGRLDIDDEMNDIQERLISGFTAFELGSKGNDSNSAQQKPTTYFPRGSDSCPNNISSNIKVNQNCLNLTDPDLQGRGQAQNETSIAQDPNQPNHIIASYNDYRRGDGNCGVSYSLDKGRTWNDVTSPTSFTRGRAGNVVDFGASREYW